MNNKQPVEFNSSIPTFIKSNETNFNEKSMNGFSKKVISIPPKQGNLENNGVNSNLKAPEKVISLNSTTLDFIGPTVIPI